MTRTPLVVYGPDATRRILEAFERHYERGALNPSAGPVLASTEAMESVPTGGDDGDRASRRKAGARSPFSSGGSPPASNTGGKPRKAREPFRYQARVDWLTIVVPGLHARTLAERVSEFFGQAEKSPGGCFQPLGQRWEGGARLFHDVDGKGLGVLQITGKAMEVLEEVCGWRDFYRAQSDLCARVTRCDLAIDVYNSRDDLISLALKACQDGELCGAKTFRDITESGLYGVTGRTLYLGKRGKDGSGRFGRWYDKGLESGAAPAGAWTRLEVEYTGAAASLLVHEHLLKAEDVGRICVSNILGAFQFRENNGAEHVDRRPLLPWFRRLVAGTSKSLLKVSVSRFPAEWESYREWVRTACVPGFRAIAGACGMTLAEFLASEAGDIEAATGVRYADLAGDMMARNRVIEEYRVLFERGAA